MARDMNKYNPDSALVLAQKAFYLAVDIKDEEGQSRSLGILANTFMIVGNYPRALELNIQKLKLEEKRNKPRNLASVLMNIGIVYVGLEEYRQALIYYTQADSVINSSNVEDLKYNIVLNLGDVYNKLNISDSALVNFKKALEFAIKHNSAGEKGNALTGLGHCLLKLESYDQSRTYYQTALAYLREANDDEVFCEAALGLANLYRATKKYDSSGYYANESLVLAKKDGFLSQELAAAEFLTEHYKETRNIDKAFSYITYVHELNDSVNSKSRIRESQVISSNEQFRQIEREEDKKNARKKRVQQLQMLLIAIFIPGLFLITLLMSRIRIHTRVIRLLGILSLLFLFEYLTLLLHPTVANLTHHSPVLEILIFVVIAAIIIPLHHKLEHWLIHKLNHIRAHHEAKVRERALATLQKSQKKPG